MEHEDLCPEDCKLLEEVGIFLSVPQNGKRKVSASFLTTPPSSSASSVINTSSTASVVYRRTAVKQDFELPERLESAAALEFSGLQPEIAKELFRRYVSGLSLKNNPNHLLDYVTGHTNSSKGWDDVSDEDTLLRLGIASWLRRAILDPNYAHIYSTRLLIDWLNESLAMNFNSLERYLSQLKAYATASSSNPVDAPTQQGTTIGSKSQSDYFPIAHVSMGSAKAVLPGHEVYYMAKALDEMVVLDPLINTEGDIDMPTLASWQGGDFNALTFAWYFTPEPKTAKAYLEYCERRNPYGDHWLVRIEISAAFSRQLKKEELFYSSDWKEYVWYCKRTRAPPEKFQKYYVPGAEQTHVMLGHICNGVTKKFLRMPKERVQEDITEEDNVMVIDGKKAKQWVVMHADVAARLAIEVKGKMHIDIFTGTGPKD